MGVSVRGGDVEGVREGGGGGFEMGVVGSKGRFLHYLSNLAT